MTKSLQSGRRIAMPPAAIATQEAGRRRRGATVAETWLGIDDLAAVQRRLADAAPVEAVTRVLASLERHAGCSVSYRTLRELRGEETVKPWVYAGWQVRKSPDFDRDQALAMVARLLVPTPFDMAVTWLTALGLKSQPRGHDDDNWRAVLTLYAGDLGDHPPDIVRHALASHADRCPFWPAWNELAQVLVPQTEYRESLYYAIQEA